MTDRAGLVAEAAGAFEREFGHGWRWGGVAPGRVNLIGEHTDYNGGFVLPMAIDRWCVCLAAPAASGGSRLTAGNLGARVECSLAEHQRGGPRTRDLLPMWARYVVGSVVEHATGMERGAIPELDMLVLSTVPYGSGLSSSASLETACASMLESLAQLGEASPIARALDCQRAEHRWAGVPCGLMDQLSSSCGQDDHALLIDCRDNSVTPLPLPGPTTAELLVINTGVHHDLAAGEYAKRRAACESASATLGVSSLREVSSLETVDWPRLNQEQSRCVRHVVGENARVLAAGRSLRDGDLSAFGRLMLESHVSLRDEYRVSCRELDTVVDLALRSDGVYGARMTGGGFGGCAVVLAEPGCVATLLRSIPPAYLEATGVACEPLRVRAVGGATALTA